MFCFFSSTFIIMKIWIIFIKKKYNGVLCDHREGVRMFANSGRLIKNYNSP